MNLSLPSLKSKAFREKYAVGLDIGTSVIKLCKLRLSKETTQVCDFHTAPVSPSLPEALKALSPRFQDTKSVNISLCGPAAIIRYINFPRMSIDELKKALKFEAQKYIPFSVAEVNLDAAILKPEIPDNKMLVALAAVKKDFTAERLKVFDTNGPKISFIDLDSFALINAFNFNYPAGLAAKPKSVALVNIGSAFTNLNILEDGIPLLSRDINIAGNNFTQNIADNFGINFTDAEKIKINPDKEKIEQISQSVEAILSDITAEIRVSFDYFESQSASSVTKIFLTGGGSLFPGLKDSLANILSVEVEFWDPLKQITIAANVDASKLQAVSNQFAVAIGLAVRG